MTEANGSMDSSMRRRLWARSLLLQSCWNFEGMQNLGLAFGLEPWLSRLYPRPADSAAALSRHQEYFNTNPYTETLIVGMVCALEQDAAALPQDQAREKFTRISMLKKVVAPPLAGLGDALFWQTLRPLAAASALLVGFFLRLRDPRAAAVGMAFCYLLVYNMAAATLRWKGVGLGYEWREQLAIKLKAFPWQVWIKRLRIAGTVMAAALFCAMLASGSRPARVLGALSLPCCLIADRIVLRPVSVVRLYTGACVVGVLASAAGWL